jgi:hypothetical protein
MLAIKKGNEFLDLAPGSTLEIEIENPLLQFNDEIKGGYSLPVLALDTEKNAKFLNYAGLFQKVADNTGIDVVAFDNGIPSIAGKLKIEKTVPDLNKQLNTAISTYLVTDAGDFFQEIKEKRLRDINAGGVRSFEWDGLTTISGTGFWKHIHDVANAAVNAYDYAFYPVLNDGWEVDGVNPGLMNRMNYISSQAQFSTNYTGLTVREVNRIVPFPYLHYILKKAFEHVGWTLQGDFLTDNDFIKITIINFRAINWATVHVNSGTISYTAHDPVEFDLKDHLPDMGIGQFLIALKNRFGWWYDFNKTSKICTIKMLRDVPGTDAKDITTNVNPVLEKTVLQDAKVYALRNNIEPVDLTKVEFMGTIGSRVSLPTPSETIFGQVYFVYGENVYFICEQADDESWYWAILAHNTFDFVPTGANEDIITSSQIPEMEYSTFHKMILPRYDNAGEWDGRNDDAADWPLILCFFHGMLFNTANDAAYPYGSPHPIGPRFTDVGNWGLSYTATSFQGDEVGIHATFWKAFLDMLTYNEQVELTWYAPLQEYLNLRFEQQLVVAGVKLFIKTLRPVIPYKDVLSITCVRI